MSPSFLGDCRGSLCKYITLRKFKNKSALSLMASKDLMYLMLAGLLSLSLGLDLPSLEWIDRFRLLGFAALSIAISLLNIVSLKVEEATRVSLMDRCSGIVIAFLTQVWWCGRQHAKNGFLSL